MIPWLPWAHSMYVFNARRLTFGASPTALPDPTMKQIGASQENSAEAFHKQYMKPGITGKAEGNTSIRRFFHRWHELPKYKMRSNETKWRENQKFPTNRCRRCEPPAEGRTGFSFELFV